MAIFTHIFPESLRDRIRRNGLTVARAKRRTLNGIFVSPVTENYLTTHEWYREVDRNRNVPKLAARIRIPDGEKVLIGKFNGEHVEVEANEAIDIARQHVEPGGLEVIIRRRIKPSEILTIYKPNKVAGWRYYPGSHGSKPCGCVYCQRGEPNSRRLQERDDPDRYKKRKSAKKIERENLRELVSTATNVLQGNIGMTEGCRLIADIMSTADDADYDFTRLFEEYDSETSSFPLGDERTYWSTAALKRKDDERTKFEEQYRARVRESCQELMSYAKVNLA